MRKITVLLAFLFLAGMQIAHAQTRTISGKVTSAEDGQGIPGVTIQVKGTAVGTVTDIDGNYSLEIKPSYKTLMYQYVGMKTQTIAIGDQNNINIALETDVLQMEEVVVTAIGIPKNQKALGYTVQDVSSEQIAKSGNTNIVSALEGRVAGLQVTSSSAAAGGAQYVTIRGATSIIGNNQPLFVVDGVPIDNSVTRDVDGFQNGDVAGVARSNRVLDLNPEDIENISVLKGGAASALYGSLGSNGVIVITTKKGAAGKGKKVTVNFTSDVQFTTINKTQLPGLNEDWTQGWNGDWSSGFFASWGARKDTMGYSRDQAWIDGGYAGFDTDGDIVARSDPRYDESLGSVQRYDPFDFFQTGVRFNNSISLTGGTDKGSFYVSASDMSDKGVVPNNKVRRNTFKVSGTANMNDKWKISGNANYIRTTGDRIQQGSNTSGVMLGLVRTPPTFNNEGLLYLNGEQMAPNSYEFNDGSQRNYRHGGGYDNPYWTANKNLWQDEVNRLIGNIQVDWFATDFLRFTYRPGLDWYSEEAKDYLAVGSRTSPGGRVFARNTVNWIMNQDIIGYFDYDFNENWGMYATAGFNWVERRWNYVYGQADGLSIPEYYNLNNSANILSAESTWRKRMMGVYFDIGFDFKSMLFVNVTGRNDWSTTLPEENNSYFYPSISAGFVFTEIAGLKDGKVVPYWKVFASYARTGSDADPYRTKTYFFQAGVSDGWVSPLGVNFPISTNGVTYNGFTYGNTMGSNSLKPEFTTTWEIGTNIKFVNNRVGLDMTYFNNQSTDLLLPVDIDPATGFSSMFINAASMESVGFEITLYATIIKSKNFTWDILVNFSRIKNNVIELAENVDAIFLGGFTDPQIRAVAGEEYRTIYGYDWLRDDNGNVLINDDPNSTWYGYPSGDYTLTPLGKVNPDWTMGVSNTFAFYGVTIYGLLDVRQGTNMWNGTRGALNYFGMSTDNNNRDDEVVIFEGVKSDGSTNDINVADQGNPNWAQTWATSGEGSGFTGPTVEYIEDASWVRLRELTVAYSFNKVLSNSRIDNLEIYFTGRNLWLSTPYTGIDPETSLLGASNAQGMDYFNMPGTRSYLIGLRLAF